MNKLEEAGYKGTEITMKTDQEESIMALKRAVAARREAIASLIESKVRVSVLDGRVERAVRKWRGQFRKIKHHVESKIGRFSSRSSNEPVDYQLVLGCGYEVSCAS